MRIRAGRIRMWTMVFLYPRRDLPLPSSLECLEVPDYTESGQLDAVLSANAARLKSLQRVVIIVHRERDFDGIRDVCKKRNIALELELIGDEAAHPYTCQFCHA